MDKIKALLNHETPGMTQRYVSGHEEKLVYKIPVGMQDFIEVIGYPNMASYEWMLREPEGIIERSNDNYGSPEAALRDGLIFYLS